jgi:aminotransferase
MFERTEKISLSIIKQIELKASKFPDAISLAQGIPSFDTPECIKRRVERALKRGVVAKYSLSPGLPELRELIEIQLEKENMFYDWEKEIVVTAGTIQGITATILAITSPGDEVIIPEPTYTSYKEVIYLAGCKPVFVSLNEEKGWSFEIENYEKAITPKTRAIFFCNPNNPTGTIYSREQQLALADLAVKHDLFIITDEVYKDFVYNGEKIFSLAEVPELRDRVIRIYGFSKAYAMTGWRVGYVHSDEKIIKEIIKVHDSLVTCAPVVSQYAAMGALEMGEKDLEIFNKKYKKRRELMCSRLDKLDKIFSYVHPQSSYYIFPRIKSSQKSAWDFALELLDKTHVAVVPGHAFGPNGENHIRLSFGRSEADINEAFDRFDKYFNNK